MYLDMNDNDSHIVSMTVVEELVRRVKNVFAERLKLESPFVSASTACIRAFLLPKISGFKLSFPDSLSRVDKKSKHENIRLCDRLSNLNLETRVKQRDQGLLPSCELTGFTKRLIDGEGLIITLIRYMRMVLLGSRGKAVLRLKLNKGEMK